MPAVNQVKQTVLKTDNLDVLLAELQDTNSNKIAEVWWDGERHTCFLSFVKNCQQVSCLGYNNMVGKSWWERFKGFFNNGEYKNNQYNLKTGDTFYFTTTVSTLVNSNFWLNNCTITLDNQGTCLSFDFNISSVNDNYFQLLSAVVNIS